MCCRSKALTAHIISPGVGASFSMLLADMKAGATAGQPPPGVERCLPLVLGVLVPVV